MADTNTTDVRMVSAAEAAEDAELWAAVGRGECEVTYDDAEPTVGEVTVRSLLHFSPELVNNVALIVEPFGYAVTIPNLWPMIVRRVQPAGDERKWWYTLLEDEIPRYMTAEESVNYTGPFESEQEAFIACIIEHGERSDRLLAELKTAEGALEAITMSDLAAGTACEWCGGIRWKAEGDRPDIDHAPNCPVRIAQEALAALRADSEHDSAAASK